MLFDYNLIKMYKAVYEYSVYKPDMFKDIKIVLRDDDVNDDEIEDWIENWYVAWQLIGKVLTVYGCKVSYLDEGEEAGEDENEFIDGESVLIAHKSFSDLANAHTLLNNEPAFKEFYGKLYAILDNLLSVGEHDCIWLSHLLKDGAICGIQYSFPEGTNLSVSAIYYLIYSVIRFCEEVQKQLPGFLMKSTD